MKILHVNDHLAPKGGVETYLLSVAPELERRGHELAFAFGAGDAALVKHSHEIPCLSDPGWVSKTTVHRAIGRALDESSPDVVHLHSIYNPDAIEFLLDRVPVVVTSHDYRYLCPASNFYYRSTEETCQRTCSAACAVVTLRKKCLSLRPKYGWKYLRRVQRIKARFGDFRHLVAPSQNAADRFRHNGFDASRITVLPYFCRIKPLDTPRPIPKRNLMLYLGRLSSNKGWHYFVEALSMLPANIEGLIVGNVSGDSEKQLQSLAQELRCNDRLHWQRWASPEEIRSLFLKASVLVFPSVWEETLGIVGLEAMAHGVPVVASDIGGVREWLKDGQNGYLVPPGDASEIADAVTRITSSQQTAAAMGESGLNYLKQRFLPDQHVSTLTKIYRECVH